MAKALLPSDDELIPKLLAVDGAAYAQVVDAYHGIMIHVARAIVGDAIADEVAQESWVSVMRALPRFERRSSLKTWILSIVSNTAKSRLRHESRTVNFDDSDNSDKPIIDPARFTSNGRWLSPPKTWHADTPDALLASEQTRLCINTALDLLPPMQRAVITLRDMQGMDMETICRVLEVTETNGRVLLHRARSSIHTAIDDHNE